MPLSWTRVDEDAKCKYRPGQGKVRDGSSTTIAIHPVCAFARGHILMYLLGSVETSYYSPFVSGIVRLPRSRPGL
ncbi:hypothetical protein Trisim1_005151 [Trichoderma cf. simile WF8]